MRAGPTVFPAQAAAVEQETDKLVGFPITALRLLLHGCIVGGQTSQVKILFLAPPMRLQFPIFHSACWTYFQSFFSNKTSTLASPIVPTAAYKSYRPSKPWSDNPSCRFNSSCIS